MYKYIFSLSIIQAKVKGSAETLHQFFFKFIGHLVKKKSEKSSALVSLLKTNSIQKSINLRQYCSHTYRPNREGSHGFY